MFLTLLTTALIFAPQTAAADVARLATLFDGGAQATLADAPDWNRSGRASLSDWGSCKTGLRMLDGIDPNDKNRFGQVDWSTVAAESDGRVVRLKDVTVFVGGAKRMTLHLRFADKAAASEALTLIQRRTTACSAQR